MGSTSKILPVSITAAVLALIMAFIPFSHAVPQNTGVLGTVTIVGGGATCGLDVVSGSPIAYGSLAEGQLSEEQMLSLNNTGNTPSTLMVAGFNWDDGATEQMAVENTHYAASQGLPYANKISLTDQYTNTGMSMNPGVPKDIFWQLEVHLTNPAFTGQLFQDTIVQTNC